MKPLIGLTMQNDKKQIVINEVYVKSIIQAGGIPVCLPITPLEEIPSIIERLDGLLLIGGQDINPLQYDQPPHPKLGETVTERDDFELALFLEAFSKNMPVLGICRGQQLVNVALGGTLIQDIPSQVPNAHQHSQSASRVEPIHKVRVIHPAFKEIFQTSEFAVNSFHHQSVNVVGEGLSVAAVAEDGIIEGLIHERAPYCVTVQWHPEEMAMVEDVYASRLFKSFITACFQKK